MLIIYQTYLKGLKIEFVLYKKWRDSKVYLICGKWLLVPLKAFWITLTHMCSYSICGLNLLGWVELILWDTACTLPEAIIRMSLCLCVCFMSGLCRLLGFAAAYLYSVLWNIFQTLWSTWGDPTPTSVCGSGVLSWKHENWHIQVEMFRPSLSAILNS